MKQKRFLIGVSICIVILLGLIGVASFILISGVEAKELPEISDNSIDASDPILTTSSDEDYFELVGYGELEISSKNPNINLINTSENNVYLSFGVYYNDDLLYQSKLIAPGKMEQYDVYRNLDAGQHTLTYSINVYDTNENILWSGIQQEQEILIKN